MEDRANVSGGLGEYAYTGNRVELSDGRTAADVLKDIVANLQEIVRSEVRLAKAEFREDTGKLMKASAMLVAGAVLAIYALFFVFQSAVYGLATVMSPWLAALLVGVALAAVAAVMVSTGRGRLRGVSPKPERTIDTMKENVEWMKNQTRS
jgi:hypothetical protein